MSYEGLAYYYDSFMDESFYDDYEAFILQQCSFDEVLELGCGTGEIALRLVKDGKKVWASDISNDMLEVAQMKAQAANIKVNFKRVDMRAFQVDKKLDLILCLCDSINYITKLDEVYKTFCNVYDALKKEGCFIFDSDSLYKTDVILKDYKEEEKDDQFSFYWSADLIESGYVHHFIKIDDDEYDEHIEENHYQRTYDYHVYLDMLDQVGFHRVKVFSDFGPFKQECERFIFVCFKGEKEK